MKYNFSRWPERFSLQSKMKDDHLHRDSKYAADLMVLDMIMDPGMDGLETYRSILQILPKQKAIIVSGFFESERVHAAHDLGAGVYVRKPYVIEKLGLAVRKELHRSA
jgi:DNA-binding NarL/FixJ family response regulator